MASVPKLALNQASPTTAAANRIDLAWTQTTNGNRDYPILGSLRKPGKGCGDEDGSLSARGKPPSREQQLENIAIPGSNGREIAVSKEPVASGTLLLKPKLLSMDKPGEARKARPRADSNIKPVASALPTMDEDRTEYQIFVKPPSEHNDENEPEDEGSIGIPTTSTVLAQSPTTRDLRVPCDFGEFDNSMGSSPERNEVEVQTDMAQLVDTGMQTDALELERAPVAASRPEEELPPSGMLAKLNLKPAGMIPKLNLGSLGLGNKIGKKLDFGQAPGSANASHLGDDEAVGNAMSMASSVASSEDVFENKKDIASAPKEQEHDPTLVPVVAPTVVFDENVRLRKLCIDLQKDFKRELAQLKASADGEVLSVFEENKGLKEEIVVNKALCEDLKRESNELNVAALADVASLRRELEALKDEVQKLHESAHPAAFVKVAKTENAKLQDDLKEERARAAELGTALTFERCCNVEMRIEANLASDKHEKLSNDLVRTLEAKQSVELDLLEISAECEELHKQGKTSGKGSKSG